MKSQIPFSQLKRMIIESLMAEDKSEIQGLEHYSENEIKKMIVDQVFDRIDAAGVSPSEFSLMGVAIFGSRNRGTGREDSDLDAVIEYSGTMREDDVFNILHDEDYEYGTMEIDGIPVDVNPIREQESGSMGNFLKKSKEYDRQQIEKELHR